MHKRVGCLHAHHSNIAYIEQAFSLYNIELIHVVNPVILERLNTFSDDDHYITKEKLKQQVNELFSIHVDAVIITCSTYSGLLEHDNDVALIKIDDPFLTYLSEQGKEVILLFTNPTAITHTELKLNTLINEKKKAIQFTSYVISNTFQLIMNGKQEEYNKEICSYLEQVIETNINNGKLISVAQLSMVDAANKIASKYDIEIVNPLDLLVLDVLHKLNIEC